MREEWRDVEGTGYKVSSLGRVIGRRGGILNPSRTPLGYRVISIDGDVVYVHRLVAEAFLGRFPGMQVDHIDGDKNNNAVSNLRWVTAQENVRHSYDLGRGYNRKSRTGIPVVMICGEERTEYPSMSAAARATGKSQSWVWQAVACGHCCGGVRWEYA